jgi:hypothetical protein
MSDDPAGSDHHAEAWERSERRTSFRIALAIAFLPIPISLLIAWALGNPPWRTRSDRGDRKVAPAGHRHP